MQNSSLVLYQVTFKNLCLLIFLYTSKFIPAVRLHEITLDQCIATEPAANADYMDFITRLIQFSKIFEHFGDFKSSLHGEAKNIE